MIGHYVRLPDADLQKILQSPASILEILYPQDDLPFAPERYLDIDKAWHLIHFLLTGKTWDGEEPMSFAVLGGKLIGEVDVGYGPARYLSPTQVEATAKALADISPNELWKRFDRQQVRQAEIYPSGWGGNETERDYILQHFSDLKSFFSDAASDHDAMILYIN